MDTVSDLFCVGELAKDLGRWRPFVDVSPEGKFDPTWHPQLHNTKLLAHHRDQGQVVYEHALMLESIRGEREWKTKPLLTFFKVIAEIEMRCIEVEICSFQMTCNTVGINCSAPLDDLYVATAFAHAANLYLFDLACAQLNRRHGRGEIDAEKPSRTDTAKQLAANLDRQIFAVHLLCKEILPRLQKQMVGDQAAGVAHRLRMMMRALDKVIVVTP